MTDPAILLPGSLRVIVRGWLNCNQIVALSEDAGNVLIDSGYSRDAAETLRLLALPQHLGAAPLARIVNTHCHSDHMGGNAALARRYGCSITVPEGEARHLRPWDAQALWMAYADQYAEPFEFHDTVAAGASFEAGGLRWEALAAPGHDMDALMFWCAEAGVLISGDALWENGLGFVFPKKPPNEFTDAALATLARIEALAPRVVIPGHGAPFADAAAAVRRARSRLEAFAADPVKNARHVAKVMFVFALLDKGSMSVADVEAYLQRVPCYADLNGAFLRMAPRALAEWLVGDLAGSGAVTVNNGAVTAAMAA